MKMGRVTRNQLGIYKGAIAAFLFCVLATIGATAQVFTSLADFEETNGGGAASLVRGFDGNFYGVTFGGGSHAHGTIFRITPSGTLADVYDFCSQHLCADGNSPQLLIIGRDGNLYGATGQGGDPNCNGGTGCGIIFKLTNRGVFSVLYSFSLTAGADPQGLTQGMDGSLYGVANSGGSHDYGSVFKLTPAGQFTLLYSFCSLSHCADGSFPYGNPIQTSDGTLYGMTDGGGAKGVGTIFKIAPDGTFSTLHSFTGGDGSGPVSLIQGADGNLYGLTDFGGAHRSGTIFRITTAGQLTTLYSFCSQAGCTDGTNPERIVQATDGNLYGATGLGGVSSCGGFNSGCGTLFQFTSSGTFTTLHAFDATDGSEPNSLLQDTSGNFYGTSLQGGDVNGINCSGSNGCGTVFELSMGLGPFVELQHQSGSVGQTGGILGRGFTGTTGVFLNGTPATFTAVSDTFIRATVPAGATSGFVTVQTPSGMLTSNVPFQVKQ